MNTAKFVAVQDDNDPGSVAVWANDQESPESDGVVPECEWSLDFGGEG